MNAPARERAQVAPERLISETDGTLLSGLGHAAGAVFSEDRVYRYVLTRTWAPAGPVMCWIMLNPSAADAMTDDPTIRRCTRFARREGCAGITVVNLFALRTASPALLRHYPDPVGPGNDRHIDLHTAGRRVVVAAWGAGGGLYGRAGTVAGRLAAAGVQLRCLGVTDGGQPRHPLYVRADVPLIPWEAP